MPSRWLIINKAGAEPERFDLEIGSYAVGRAPASEIRLESERVSAKHASLVCAPRRTTIIDLDSTNGTLVNDEPIRHQDLRAGDTLRFGDISVSYHEEDDVAPDQDPSAHLHASIRDLVARAGGTAADVVHLLSGVREISAETGRTNALYQILEHTLNEADRKSLVRCFLKEIQKLLDLSVCGLFLVAEERFYFMDEDDFNTEEETQSVSQTALRKTIDSGQPVFLENIGADSENLGFQSLVRFKIQSLICLPLKSGEKTIGVLYCVSRNPARLHSLENDRQFLEACSRILSLSLESVISKESQREKSAAQEKKRQESRFIPVIRRLQQEKESLALRAGKEEPAAPSIPELLDFVQRAAKADLPVLLTGETGVGKSLWAQRIHEASRPGKPFVVVDCTTLPAELVESELFGHEKGAFTGALSRKSGKVNAAQDGTLFVDEIGDLPLTLQGKLLRLIQTGEFEMVGSTTVNRVKARMIFATNHSLSKMAAEGRFRQDLYFRLNVLNFTLPPLRQKREMIPLLASQFLESNRARVNPQVRTFDTEAIRFLQNYSWPGNIRELENAVLRGLFNAKASLIAVDDLKLDGPTVEPMSSPTSSLSESESLDLWKARENVDRIYIERALHKTGRNVSKAAKELNVNRNTLMELIKKYGF